MATKPNIPVDDFAADEPLDPVDIDGDGTETDEADDPQPESDDADLSEEAARAMGWKTREEWIQAGGNPDEWTDWTDFLDTEHKNAPQLRHRTKVLQRRLDQESKRYKRLEKDIEALKGYVSTSEQRAYEKLVAELREKQREAAELGDAEAVDAAGDELAELYRRAPAAPAAPQPGPEVAQSFIAWKARGGWYENDMAMTAVADAYAQKIGTWQDLNMDPGEYLELLESHVRKEFPHKFDKPAEAAPRRRSAVAPVMERRAARGEETFENLPRDAREQFARFEKMGVPIDKAVFTQTAWETIKQEKSK